MIRIALFLILISVAVLGPWWLFAVGVFGYVLVYEGLEVILLGVAIDGYYGTTAAWPLYTLISGSLALVLIYARPYLSV